MGRLKMKNEKGLGVAHGFQEYKVGRISWFPRVGWEGWKLLLLEIPLVDESDRCGTCKWLRCRILHGKLPFLEHG